MFRRYSLILVMLAVLGAGVYAGYYLIWGNNQKSETALTFIPSESCVVVTGQNLFELSKHLENTSLLWQDIRNSGSELFSPGFLEIGCALHEGKLSLLPFAWSLQNEGHAKTSCLLVISVNNSNVDEWAKQWSNLGYDVNWKSENKKSFTLKKDRIKYVGTIIENIVLVATQQSLIDNALAQHKKGTPVTNEPGFKKISATAEEDAQVHIYFRHSAILAMLAPIVNKNSWPNSSQVADLEKSYWDIKVEHDALALNGFVFSGNEMNSPIDIMAHQKPVEPKILKWLPENVVEFLYMGFSSKAKFLDNIQAVSGRQKIKAELDAFNQQYKSNLERHLLSWLDNELLYFNTGDSSRILVMKVDEVSNPQEELNFLSKQLDSLGIQNISYNGVVMRKLDAENLFSPILGSFLNGLDRPYYLQIDNVVVFGTTPQSIFKYLEYITSDKRYIRNAMVYDDLHHYFSSASNIIYHRNSSGPEKWNNLFNPILGSLDKIFPVSANISSVTCQVSNSNKGMFYSNVLLKYRQSGQTFAMPTIFEVPLDTPAFSRPFTIPNHLTNSYSVIIQDISNKIYCISATGKTQWKVRLTEPIVGDLQYIDIYGNGKYQAVFATKTKLHIIDLKGHYVAGFPVDLQKEITAAPAILDYESNRKYRFLVPCGNRVYNIDKEGKYVKGFEHDGIEAKINQRPSFMRLDNKDYLFVSDELGNIQFLDRKGKPRHKPNFNLHDRSTLPIVLEAGKSLETSRIIYSNKFGRIIRVYINGARDSLQGHRIDMKAGFAYTDVDSDGFSDFIFSDSSRICVAGTDYKIKNTITATCQKFYLYVHKQASAEPVLAGRCEENEMIFAYDIRGNSLTPTRLKCDRPFTIADLNKDGRAEIIYTYADRLFVYSIR